MEVTLGMGTEVDVTFANAEIHGIVVGKGTFSGTDYYIVKCTDGQIPNDEYGFDTFLVVGDTTG